MKTFLIKTGLFVALLTLTSSGKIGISKKDQKKIDKTMNEFENRYIDEGSVYYGIAKGIHSDFNEAKASAIQQAKMFIGINLNGEIESAMKVESSSDSSNMAGKTKSESIRTSNSKSNLRNAKRIDSQSFQLKDGNTVYIAVVRYDAND